MPIANYGNLVIKIINLKLYTNCGIIALVMGIILNIIGNIFSIAQKYLSIIGRDLSMSMQTC